MIISKARACVLLVSYSYKEIDISFNHQKRVVTYG